MNPFLLGPTDRLHHWKNFRHSLVDQPIADQITAVAEYWSHTPIGALAYDPYDETTWLSPWELLYHNQWCRSSVALGMDNTLRLAGIDPSRMQLRLLSLDNLLILIVDDRYVLNYDWGSVRAMPLMRQDVIRQWQFRDRGYFQMDISNQS